MVIQTPKTIAEVISRLYSGFTFDPTDRQLLLNYLKPKILAQLPDRDSVNMLPDRDYVNMLPVVDVLEFEPCDLHSLLSHMFSSEKVFFFCQLKPKYPRSDRYDRTTKAGFWKPTGGALPIKEDNGDLIGAKRILVFHEGHMPQGKGTGWVMHEFHLNPKSLDGHPDANKELRYVVCWIKNNKKLMTGHTPTSVNEAAAATHPEQSLAEFMQQLPPIQQLDGNQLPAEAQQGSLSIDFLNDSNDFDRILSPASDPRFNSGLHLRHM